MAKHQKPSPSSLLKTIKACIENGERLLEETHDLEFRKPPSSRFFLVMIAQEEFAKAFILFLVRENIVLFSRPILRAINDHACKQLVSMIMDYMIMHWDDIEELKIAIKNDHDLNGRLPNDVGSAMELLRYEKIGRWESNNWVWAEDPKYDTSALQISDGKKDRRKQDALYVRVGPDGRVCSTPSTISEDEMHNELERACRHKSFVEAILDGKSSSHRYDKAMAALKILFG
ncbi:MAG: hypothetical protein LCH62_01740 [Proteobacteria bacterium]|nr:hypothetical protein [Pseudomonadota bacterium]MCA0448472.1 hypothetical protein [Pseudomonadota bacterium]